MPFVVGGEGAERLREGGGGVDAAFVERGKTINDGCRCGQQCGVFLFVSPAAQDTNHHILFQFGHATCQFVGVFLSFTLTCSFVFSVSCLRGQGSTSQFAYAILACNAKTRVALLVMVDKVCAWCSMMVFSQVRVVTLPLLC